MLWQILNSLCETFQPDQAIKLFVDKHVDRLDEFSYGGDATRRVVKMHAILECTQKAKTMKLQLSAMLNMRMLVSTTSQREADRLELHLVYDLIERLSRSGESEVCCDGVMLARTASPSPPPSFPLPPLPKKLYTRAYVLGELCCTHVCA